MYELFGQSIRIAGVLSTIVAVVVSFCAWNRRLFLGQSKAKPAQVSNQDSEAKYRYTTQHEKVEQAQREQAGTLYEVASVLNISLDHQQVLQLILEQLARVVEYDSASLMLVHDQKLSIVAHCNLRSEKQLITSVEVRFLPHIQEVLEQRHPVIIPDTSRDERWQVLPDGSYIRCWMGVPLTGKDQVIGLLNLDKAQPGFYTRRDTELALAFANHAASAIENARLFESAQRRAQEAETLRQATAAVLSTLNLNEALERILVQLERVVPYDSASVQLLYDGYVEIVDGRGWKDPKEVLGYRFPIPADNPNTVVIQERRPYIVADAYASHASFHEKAHHFIRSWLGVPLIVHEQMIGMLALDSVQPNYFDPMHARLVSAFADQVAIAIENARLYTAESRRVDELDALRATVADISAELELSKLLKAILERATALLDASGGDLGLYDESRKEILIVVSHNMGKDYAGTRMALGEGAMGRVAETCLPVIVYDYNRWGERSPQYTGGNWHTVVAVPLLVGGRLLGAIGIVDSNQKRQFSTSDQHLLNLFAQQAAIAVENARLYQSAREAADRRIALHKVSQQIVAASLEPEEIYTAIHQAAAQLMPAEAFVITLLDEASQMIEAVYLVDQAGRTPVQRMPAHTGLSGKVIDTEQSLYIEDIVEETSGHSALSGSIHFGDPEEEVRSILAVPMRLRGAVKGMLSAQSYRPCAFNPEDQYLLEMLASYAAIALDNARLFGEVQQLAITDSVTGIYNHRHLFELAQREFIRARRFKRPLSAIMLDIDHFKRVNDTYLHDTGNQVLYALAQRLQASIREVDILGRYGGEEFTMILPESDLAAAYLLAERLRSETAAVPFLTDKGAIEITVSLGVATLTEDHRDLQSLVKRADAAMYEAKHAGRNRVEIG